MEPVEQVYPEFIPRGTIHHAHNASAALCNRWCHIAALVEMTAPEQAETKDDTDDG